MASIFKPFHLFHRTLSTYGRAAKKRSCTALVLCLLYGLFATEGVCAQSKFVQWAENPLGFYPVGLEGGTGFAWGVSAITTTFLLGEIFSKKDTLTKYRFSVFDEPGVTIGYGNRQGFTVGIDNAGVQYRVLRWMGVGGEITSYLYQGPLNNTAGFGARPFARWYIVHKNNFDLFFEYGAGIIWNLKNFPITNDDGSGRVGTQFNFTPKYSIGVDFRLEDQTFFSVGVRHVHVSNGYIFGPDRNPAFDSDGFFISIRFDRKLPLVDPLFDNSRIAFKRKAHKKQRVKSTE
jgi:lipid A 3-O-deacylase PagL